MSDFKMTLNSKITSDMFGTKVYNSLRLVGVETVGQLIALDKEELLRRGGQLEHGYFFREQTVNSISTTLNRYGFNLGQFPEIGASESQDLRDYFAAKLAPAIFAKTTDPALIAKTAYQIADAMLREKSK